MNACTVLPFAPALLGEGSIWHDGHLWWVDIEGRQVHRLEPVSGVRRSWAMPSYVGTVVPAATGGVLVALVEGVHHLDPESGALRLLARHLVADQRMNDGKCDPAGRLWVGTRDEHFTAEAAFLYRLEGDRLITMLDRITISNGLVWSADGAVLWYIDSRTHRIDACHLDSAGTTITRREPAVDLAHEAGEPDGMTIDAEGMLWVAMWGGSVVLRCDPRSGRVIDRLPVPARQVTSVAFGGADLGDLYVTSATTGLADARPEEGRLLRVRPGVRGVPASCWKG